MAGAMTTGKTSITLGPVLFNWPAQMWADFYARIADEAPVDRVVVGEVVCSKRSPFRIDAMADVIERLERAGKEVAIATLALPTLRREITDVVETASGSHLIEANDMTAIAAIGGRPHIVGPLVNVYNEDALAELGALGSQCVCLPPELPLSSIAALGATRGSIELEVLAFGRAPLAISARCYHARAHHLTKDACRYVCEQDLDGLEVKTLDHREFLAINGVQTLAWGCTVLSREIADLNSAGVTRIRLSPQSCDMVAVATAYRNLLDGRIEPAGLLAEIDSLSVPGEAVNGFVHGQAGAAFVG